MQQSFSGDALRCGRQVCWLPLDRIIPHGETPFSNEPGPSLSELTASIRRFGLLEPICVKESEPGWYEILSGNRRYYACRMAGFSHIDAVVMPPLQQDAPIYALIDSLAHQNLHFLEEAEAIERVLSACPITQDELSRRLGRSASYINNKLRLLKLDAPLRGYILEQGLSESHARALLRLPDMRSRMRVAQKAACEKLSVRDTELVIQSALRRLPVPPPPKGRMISLMRDHRLYLNAIRGIVEQMRETGLDAQMALDRGDSEVRIHITLPVMGKP